MMSLRLNLLSPDKKKHFDSVTKYLFIRELLEITIFTLALLAMMYLFAWWVIAGAMRDAVGSSLLLNRQAPPVNQDILNLNRQTKNIVLSGNDFALLSPKIFELAEVLPPDIKLVGIQIDRNNNTVSLSGRAATRDALLNFQKVIEKIAWIKGITTPTSQLIQKENIDFEIRGKLAGLPPLKK